MVLLKPTLDQFEQTLRQVIETITPMERVQVLIPREFSHEDGYRNWDVIEELQMNYRGSDLPPNLFITLRFNQDDEGEIIMDFFQVD